MIEQLIPLERLKERLEPEPCLGAMQLLAETYYRLGQYPQAAEASRRGLALYPDSLELRLLLGQALAAQDQWAKAEEVLQPLVAKICSLAELFHTMEQLYARRQDRRQAVRMKTLYRLLIFGEGRQVLESVAARTLTRLEKWQQVLRSSLREG